MKDTFGKALHNYWKGDHRSPYFIRRDDGYVDRGSLNDYFTKKLYPMERHIIPYAQGKILDIGCGVGRHLLYFQNRKADIIGIDTSTCAIQTCKERGCKKTKVMDIFHSQ